LNTSQSSISRHIAELEAALGASLFERHKQRVHLSEQGKHLYLRVSQGLDSIRDGLQVIADSINPQAALERALTGAVRLMRTHIRLLAQPESMRSIIGATQ